MAAGQAEHSEREGRPIELGRTQRILIGVVVAGAVVIAGIGFAGSYAAVRELAEKKGFGGFSVVFPIGIDAGICVLLALDLLLTWIRIPFPLLRQTAWLLTAATIAFNGAAAWPDPLGVGMHAVIPVLFVVAVEAARHAVGRIADITADKHMEGVRLTRWILSPIPTFKLWRRMKLWELRSYEQVIKLEQDRLIYQARLQARFGRSWRRKAPVESLMPLRLARFGVPLAETAPAGLAAAGIGAAGQQHETPAADVHRVPVQQTPVTGEERIPVGPPQQPEALLAAAGDGHGPDPELLSADGTYPEGYFDAYRAFVAQHGVYPTAHQFSYFLMDAYGIAQHDGQPLPHDQLGSMTQHFEQRDAGRSLPPQATPTDASRDEDTGDEWAAFVQDAARLYAAEVGELPDPATFSSFLASRYRLSGPDGSPLGEDTLTEHLAAVAAEGQAAPRVDAPHPDGDDASAAPVDGTAAQLTTVDRYYLAWLGYQNAHGTEPADKELSAYLAENGVTARSGAPVDPSTLRRYLPQFRIYAVWAAERQHTEQPSIADVVRQLARQGVQKRHIKDAEKAAWREREVRAMAEQAGFERRYQAITADTDSVAT